MGSIGGKRRLGKRSRLYEMLLAPLSARERFVFVSLIVGTIGFFAITGAGAATSGAGSIVALPASQCASESAWQSPHLAEGIAETFEDQEFSPANVASAIEPGALFCSGFTGDDNPKTGLAISVKLNLSEADISNEQVETDAISEAAPTISLNRPSTGSRTVDTRPEPFEPVPQSKVRPSVDDLVRISVSLDSENWTTLGTYAPGDISSEGVIGVLLPPELAGRHEELAVMLESVAEANQYLLEVDSIYLSYVTAAAKDITLSPLDDNALDPEGRPIISESNGWQFILSSKDSGDGIVQGLASRIGGSNNADSAPKLQIRATLTSLASKETYKPAASTRWTNKTLDNADHYDLSLDIPSSTNPGAYQLNLVVTDETGNTQEINQDFLWGVLAINTDRTLYRTGQTANIGMSVLDGNGAPVCNADLRLRIARDNQEIAVLDSASGSITTGSKCEIYGPHIEPDYSAVFDLVQPGNYELRLSATTQSGTFTIVDRILVQDQIDFDVSRSGPTRIFPFLKYPMSIQVTSVNGFFGEFKETVPSSFEVEPGAFARMPDKIELTGDSQTLTWSINILAGETQKLGYYFDAPDISPEFYVIGPAELTTQDGQQVFQELGQWQIAGDAFDIYRSTTYELETGQFTGTDYTLTLNNSLEDHYFAIVEGPAEATTARALNQDQVRVNGDPHSNFPTVTAANQIQLTRAASTTNWSGNVTVVECLIDCAAGGFTLREVVEHSMAAGTAGSLQTTTATLASAHTSRTVPFGGHLGGGITSADSDNNSYGVTAGVKISKTGTDQLQFDRYGAETRVPQAATLTVYVVEWGSAWNVQSANVTGTATGDGINATSEYDTASISSVNRDNTWVWGSGFSHDDGIGDGAFGQAITLGDGVAQNTTETTVAVGADQAMISPGRDFEVYIMEHPDLAVDHRFKIDGDTGNTSGYQEVNLVVDAPLGAETYDNSSTTVQYTEGFRVPLSYTSSNGSGQAYSRTGAWGNRLDTGTNLNAWRAYAGQPFASWTQVADFSDVKLRISDTRQLHYRWRDDTTDLNTAGGWLAAEDTSPAQTSKLNTVRLRLEVANVGEGNETAARTYELQFGDATGLADCSAITTWTGVENSANDAVATTATTHIDPDGELTSAGLLANTEAYTFVSGQGRKTADTTGAIGPMNSGYFSELEYAIRLTDEAVVGHTYCFRVYDTTAGVVLDGYPVFPQLTTASNTVVLVSGLGEAGTFSSAIDGGWTTVNFNDTYTTPVIVGTTNSHNGQEALVFEARNVTSTSADMRVCESEGSTANGCDTHTSETVGYLVIDASVASTTTGIEAGTFTASGNSDTNSVTTNYSESFSSVPLVFANVNTVNSTEFPIEVVIPSAGLSSFSAGICDHLQGSNDACDGTHGNETVGWVAVEPGNEPFLEQFQNNRQLISTPGTTWASISFSPSFSSAPVLLAASQTDNGGQDVEIDEARNVSTTGAEIRWCEIDTLDTCDTHNADDMAWLAIEAGALDGNVYLDQDGFRFYDNINNQTPATPLGNENTDVLNIDDGDVVRLRMALQSGISGLGSGVSFKLQYAQASNCSAAGSWNDVGGLGSGAIWRGFDNGTPADGSTLGSSLLDSGGNQLETYEEANNSSASPTSLTDGQRGEWDWVIQNNGATDLTPYCFRMVTAAGDTFVYSRIPKLTTSSGVPNSAPNTPASLGQTKTTAAAIAVGGWTNETSVILTANLSDPNNPDILQLCAEVQPRGTDFTDSDTACGTPVNYSGGAIAANVTISGLLATDSYHWQVRTRDSASATSAWISFGGNGETEADFSIDTAGPQIAAYDGNSAGVDIDFNSGELDELSANWELVPPGFPSGLPNLALWLDGTDVNANGTNPANGASVTTWFDKSGNGNDISGTGAATYDSTEQAIAFSDDVQPFDDTYDRSGGNSNSQAVFAVVTGEASVSNHVWYETTTPRVAPAENGLLGAGTQLTNNNLWSSHISDRAQFSLVYDSGGSSVSHLNGIFEYGFSETPIFADSQRLVLGDDTTGGNRLVTGEFIHELLVFNENFTDQQRLEMQSYLGCKWSLSSTCMNSPISIYEYSIGTAPGSTDILNWTNNGTSTSADVTSLNLTTSQPYYYNVRATDAAGNQTVVSTDGLLVSPTLQFSATPGSITFDNLNVSNAYTDTESSVLTTSTNAYQGYQIRAYISTLPTSPNLNVIGLFSGGTYASPDEWQGGDTGYGYTSNDTTIQSVNIFNSTPCPGGGNPPCYSPFSLTPPGDIVADHTELIAGTPVANENFVITHRVTVAPSQAAATYQTQIIYTVTARY